MKLVYPGLEYQFEFKENRIFEWVVESPVLFTNFVNELLNQTEGDEGQFVLSEDDTDYILSYENEIDFVQILKAAGVKLKVFEDNLVEKLCRYIQLVSIILCRKLLIFVNLKSFLTEEQLNELYKTAGYWKIHLILLENQERKGCSEREVRYIIDRDGCEIF